MPTADKEIDMRKEFPGDEALQQVHRAPKLVMAAAKRRRLTLGAYVRSLRPRFRSSNLLEGSSLGFSERTLGFDVAKNGRAPAP